MLLYEKKVDDIKGVYGTLGKIPSKDDELLIETEELRFKQWKNDGHGGIVDENGEPVIIVVDGEQIVPKEDDEPIIDIDTKVTTPDDIKDAINSDEFEVSLKLEDSIELDSKITVPEGKTVTLNLNNNDITVTGTNNFTVNGGTVNLKGTGTITTDKFAFQVVNGGQLNMESGNIIATDDCAIGVSDGGEVTVNGGYIQAQEAGILATKQGIATVNGGKIKGIDNFAVGGNGSKGQGGTVINIEGGTIEGNIQSAGYVACGIYHPQDGELNINGGHIIANSGCGVLMRAGQLNVSGGSISASGPAELIGKVGDSKVTVGPHAIIYDQSAHYPENQNLGIYIDGGHISSENGKSIDVLKDDDHEANIEIEDGADFNPPYDFTEVIEGDEEIDEEI